MNGLWDCILNSIVQDRAQSSCEPGNGPSNSVSIEYFLDQLSDHQILMKSSIRKDRSFVRYAGLRRIGYADEHNY
jgi:hypothetical protein